MIEGDVNEHLPWPYYTDSIARSQIDELLRLSVAIESGMGTDSTDEEKVKYSLEKRELFEQVRTLDQKFYERIAWDIEL